MALSNYSDLQAAIADFLNRQDLSASIPTFIALAEAHFRRTLKTRDCEARVITSLQYQFTELPDDYRGMRLAPKILDLETWELEPVSADELAEERSKHRATPGRPKWYSIVGNAIEVEPAPDTTYTMRLAYWQELPSLAIAGTNWLLTKHPDLYLFTCLLQAAPYLQDDERIPVWDGGRQRAIDEIMLEDQRSSFGGTPRVKARSIG